MTARQPLADIAAEAGQALAGCAAHGASARLIGGLAVAVNPENTLSRKKGVRGHQLVAG